MLRALLANKLRHVLPEELDSDEATSVRDSYRRSEDALTAAVFERLLYLPPDRSAELLAPVLDGDAQVFGPDYPQARFWPRLKLEGSHVEPDLVLAFQDRIVVVEVKWGAPHYLDQWRREVRAAAVAFTDDRELHLVLVGRETQRAWALGAMAAFRTEAAGNTRRALKTAWLSWERLYQHVERVLRAGELAPWERAVVLDIRDVLADRGLRRRSVLRTLKPTGITTTPADLLAAWPVRRGSQDAPEGPLKPRAVLVPAPGILTTPGALLAAWRL